MKQCLAILPSSKRRHMVMQCPEIVPFSNGRHMMKQYS
jgi:hypothetical protein